jgi:predicted RNase H-like HicB family nuclease
MRKEARYSTALRWDEEGWIARYPELPGCTASGRTAGKAMAALAVSRKLWIKTSRAPADDPLAKHLLP